MDIFQSIVLGVVQGLTEFIPVSSSGHLIVIGNLLGDSQSLHLSTQALGIGTTLALIIYFRHRIINLTKQVFIKHNYKLLRNVVITCLPVATIGLLLTNLIEKSPFFSNDLTVALAMAGLGLIMILLEKFSKLSRTKDGSNLTSWRALIIGLAQCAALVPGISRSGSTIAAARLMGLKNEQAAEYSFMVSIPVMLGLTGKLFISDFSFITTNWQPILIGNIIAFIIGILAIKYLLDYLAKHSLKAFGIYRLIVAVIIVICLTIF